MKRIAVVIVGILLLGIVVWIISGLSETGVEADSEEISHSQSPENVSKPPRRIRTDGLAYARPKPSDRRGEKPAIVHVEDEQELSPEEEKLLDDIGEALNDEDFEAAQRLNERAAASDKAEIRKAMVETLGWFGRQALPELTPYLADADEDVVFEATAQWQSALYEIESDTEKAKIVGAAMVVLSSEDTLDEIAGELNGMDELLSVSVLADVIANARPQGVKAAKDAYEFVTGEEWSGVDDAEAWLQENYEPEEED